MLTKVKFNPAINDRLKELRLFSFNINALRIIWNVNNQN